MDISVVIPNFNGEQLLKKNFPKVIAVLKKYKGGKAEIIVSDDASKDDSVALLRDIASHEKNVPITILENLTGKNKGFASNVNKGVRSAQGEVVILLNTDVVPHEDFLASLLPHFTDPNVFAVGCLDESIEDGIIVKRGRGIGKWRQGFLIHAAGRIGENNTTLWISGGSGAFRKDTWEKLGGLQTLYNPFYWEDIDLSYRAQKAGLTVLFEEKSIVKHEHEIGSIKKNYSSFQVKKIAYRNQFFFTWLNATDTMILVAHMVFLPYVLLKGFIRKDNALVQGFFSALVRLPQVLSEREKVQRFVTKSDKEVIQNIQ